MAKKKMKEQFEYEGPTHALLAELGPAGATFEDLRGTGLSDEDIKFELEELLRVGLAIQIGDRYYIAEEYKFQCKR